jgi:hypothetical protein
LPRPKLAHIVLKQMPWLNMIGDRAIYGYLRMVEQGNGYTDFVMDAWKPSKFTGILNQLHITFFTTVNVEIDFNNGRMPLIFLNS